MALLEVKELTKVFSSKKGKVVAVDTVSFTAREGEIFGLLGPNGAGKTTTIRVLATTLQPTSGTAIIAGFDIQQDAESVRQHIGVLTTDIGLYDRFSGRENLQYYGQLYGIDGEKLNSRIQALITQLEMESFIDRRAGKYSTGMKQKVAIARSIIHDPQVIFFDEPTSGLDVLASQTVVRFIKSAKEQNKLVILSTHQMHDAERLCDRVGIIHDGALIAIDTISALRERTGAPDLEDAFLALVKEKNLSGTPDNVVNGTDSSEGDVLKSEDPKYKTVTMLRMASFIVVALGLLALFIPNLPEKTQYFGQALVLIGALGIIVTKTFLKKYKK